MTPPRVLELGSDFPGYAGTILAEQRVLVQNHV
jgi:hypothetical protein